MTLPTSSQSLPMRRSRRCGAARWWLAGILVGCLLPASLTPVDVFRSAERTASMVLFVPAVLRAQSRHMAWVRRAFRRWLERVPLTRTPQRMPEKRPGALIVWLVAAQDVFTRRGPPVRDQAIPF